MESLEILLWTHKTPETQNTGSSLVEVISSFARSLKFPEKWKVEYEPIVYVIDEDSDQDDQHFEEPEPVADELKNVLERIHHWCKYALRKEFGRRSDNGDRNDECDDDVLVSILLDEIERSTKWKRPNGSPINPKDLGTVQELINFVRRERKWGKGCLHCAVEWRDQDFAKLLLDAGVDPNAHDSILGDESLYDPLYRSMELGDRKMAQILTKAGADMKKLNFQRAVKDNHEDVIRFSLEMGFDVDTLIDFAIFNQCTILHMAASYGKPKLLNYLLLEWNYNVNIRDSNKLSALSYAVTDGNQQCVEILLAHHTNLPAHRDSSLLALAIKKEFLGIADLLIRHVSMLQSQGPFVDPDTYIQIEQNTNAKDYMNICNFELERMKVYLVNDISLYNVLVERDLDLFVRDEFMIEMMESDNLERNFPVYGPLIRDRFDRKREKVKLEKRAITGLSRIFGLDLSGHHLIYRKILRHLKQTDLHTLRNI